jgi:uncharacterized coiled-coil DUF342 family protein
MTTASASTLTPHSGPSDEIDLVSNEMVRTFAKLSADEKRKHLEKLHAMMAADVPDGTAASNRQKFNQEQRQWMETQLNIETELEEQLEAIGFSKESQDKIAELFHRAVEDRANNDPLRQGIVELLRTSIDPFIDDESLDIVQLLANRIEQLETQIQDVETENYELAKSILDGEESITNPSNSRMPKKSTIEECMFSPTEDADALQEQEVHSRIMQQYLRGFGE